MKKHEIKVGGLYTARVSGQFVTVRVDAIRASVGFHTQLQTKEVTVYDVTNLSTNRKLTFRSAAKFRHMAPIEDFSPKSEKLTPVKERRQLTREEIGLPMPSEGKQKAEEEGKQCSDPTQLSEGETSSRAC